MTDWRSKPKRDRTRAERNALWIEKHCRIPDGRFAGDAVVLRPWQMDELRRIYDNPVRTRRAILSFAKKNAKSALACFLLQLHLAGPEAKTNSQLVSTAQSKDQAAVLYHLAAKSVRLSPTLEPFVTCRDTVKQLYCEGKGTLYKALSSDVKTQHGQSPAFAIHDELGQVEGPTSQLYTAIENAMGAHEAPLSIVISTQAPTDADLLSILIDDALKGEDPAIVVKVYEAPMYVLDANGDPVRDNKGQPVLADPFSDEALFAANPAAGDFLSLDELRATARNAFRMRSGESEYRNFTLNQRVEASSPFVSRQIWNACAFPAGDVDPEDVWSGADVFAGLDLSEANDLTAFVMVTEYEGVWHVRPTFWLPEVGIRQKAKDDRVPWDKYADAGALILTPGKTVDYDWVAEQIFAASRNVNLIRCAFDRWGMRHLRPWLIRAGFEEWEVDSESPSQPAIFQPFGQGFQDMTPALRTLESDIVNERIQHGSHPILNLCAYNAVVRSDPAGNRKLDKQKSRGRIDGMVALAMARAVAGTYADSGELDMEALIA